MKKRLKVLTALLLSAALAFTNVGATGFASEIGSPTSEIQEEIGTTSSEEAEETASTEAAGSEDASSEAVEEASTEVSGEKAEEAADGEASDKADDADASVDADSDDGAQVDETANATIVSFTYDGKAHKCSDDADAKDVAGKFYRYQEDSLSASISAVTKDEPVRTTAGVTYVRVFATEALANADASNTYSIYALVVNPLDITIESQTLYKEFDGTPLSNNDAAYTKTGSYLNTDSFTPVFDASITEPGSVPNSFSMVADNSTSVSSNYKFNKVYGDLIVTASRNGVNELATPTKVSAVIQKNGSVKLKWKAVKTFKSSSGTKKKATYYIYRYNDSGTWDLLADRVMKTTYTDSKAGDGETYIYKIIAYGTDANGVVGECETPAYIQAAPRVINATTKTSKKNINVQFIATGRKDATYTLQHWDNKKKKVTDEINLRQKDLTVTDYKAKKSTRTVSVNNYIDEGGSNVTIAGMNNHKFGFRVRANEVNVVDYGKSVTIPESKWSAKVTCQLIATAPTLTGAADSKTKIHFNWTKVKSATGYLFEYSTDKTFSKDVTQVFCDKETKKSVYNNRKVTINDVLLGVPVYAKVTAYQKTKNDSSKMGTPLDTSEVVMEYGRQGKVKNLKASFYEDGIQRSDAKLTWEYDESNIVGYYIVRDTYDYNSQTKKYDTLVSTAVLQDYKSGNNNKHWASTSMNAIESGKLIKYTVQSVYFTKDTENQKLGEKKDGYILGEPNSYYYMNPTEVSFKSSKAYKVGVGNTTATALKFQPSKQPKTMDNLSKTDFKEVYLFNNEVDYALHCDDLSATQLKKYITVDKNGKIKGIKATGNHDVYLTVSAKHDTNNVYDEVEVKVTNSSTDGNSKDDDSGKTSDLVICLDAGHGGSDPGTNGTLSGKNYKEKDINLSITKKVGDILSKKYGAHVYYSRKDDTYVSLTGRTDYAKDKGCNLFVSLHCDSSSSSSSKGTKVYYSIKKAYAAPKLASAISSGVASSMGTENDGAKTREGDNGDYYSVIRTSAAKGIPGLIVEHGFMTNESDLKQLVNNQDAIAEAEAKAIANYWNKD